MGSKLNKLKRKSIKINSHIKGKIFCPFCLKAFSLESTYRELNSHLKDCGFNELNIHPYIQETEDSIDKIIIKRVINYNKKKKNEKIKIISDKTAESFENKQMNLKGKIIERKISWQKGCCQINITRQNFLLQSIKQIKDIDLYKELKINFEGEVSYDAGGIMREWFTIIIKALESPQLNLFKSSDTNDFSYIINPFLLESKENFEYFNFIGKLIAKALLDNMTINLCFNKLIYKLILEEEIAFDDLIFIDTPLYHSLKKIKESQYNIEELGLYYSVDLKDYSKEKVISFDLIENGRNIPVVNINDYINKRIDFLVGTIKVFVEEIKKSLFNLLPKEQIIHFTCDEFELILNGRPFIDLEEWKENTEYGEPYNEGHQVIKWFWDALSYLSPSQLGYFLQFCTGSSRVPIGGFAELESNRNNISRFTIVAIPFIEDQQNYIKAHTCFNRIELPLYQTELQINENIQFIANNEILGFGID